MAILLRVIATLLGILITPVLLIVTVGLMGSGHGTYYAAKVLFPWTMMSTAATKEITVPFIALAVVQYPLYGISLDWARAKGGFKPAALMLVVVHCLAVLLAFAVSHPSFTP